MIKCETLENYKVKYSFLEDNITKGFILVEETIDVINIVDVLTFEEYRRLGISESLFKYIIDNYKDKKDKIMLEVRKSNIPAINLYKKMGFNIIHERKNYYKDDDALIMEVKLK